MDIRWNIAVDTAAGAANVVGLAMAVPGMWS
jgi:hypothetical protein